MNQDITPAETAGAKEPHDKSRAGIVDSGGSEATRELRGTARRRREAEEKLQHHLQEAKEHVKEHAEEHKHPEDKADSPESETKAGEEK